MSLWAGVATRPAQTNLKRLGGPKPREVAGRPGTVCPEASSDIHVCKAKAQNGQSSDLFLSAAMSWRGGRDDWRCSRTRFTTCFSRIWTPTVGTSSSSSIAWRSRTASRPPGRAVHHVRVRLARPNSGPVQGAGKYGRDGSVVRRPGRGGWWISRPRRNLSSFARERASGVPRAPYAWFVAEKGRMTAIDPALGDGRVVRSAEGRVERVESPADAPPEDTVWIE